MDKDQLKQRIVGAIVLVALGVIFIPMVLNQGDDATTITGTNIPPKPETLQQLAQQPTPEPPPAPEVDTSRPKLVDEFTPPVEQIDTSVTDNKGEAVKTEPAKTTDTTAAAPSKTEDKSSQPAETKTTKQRAWVVQVASFSERSKALKLRDKLRARKYPSFVESVQGKSGTYYRVRVGPEVRKEQAEQLKKKIAKEFKIKDAMVMSHP